MSAFGQSAEVARKLRATADAIEKAQKGGHSLAVQVAAARLDAAAKKRTGGDGKFSNLGKAKAVLGHKIKKTVADGGEITAHFTATGPWGLVDSDYGPYLITAKLGAIKGKGAKARRAQRAADIASGAKGTYAGTRPMKVGDGYRFVVKRKAHKAEGVWEGAREKAMKQARRDFTIEAASATRKVWS